MQPTLLNPGDRATLHLTLRSDVEVDPDGEWGGRVVDGAIVVDPGYPMSPSSRVRWVLYYSCFFLVSLLLAIIILLCAKYVGYVSFRNRQQFWDTSTFLWVSCVLIYCFSQFVQSWLAKMTLAPTESVMLSRMAIISFFILLYLFFGNRLAQLYRAVLGLTRTDQNDRNDADKS